MKNVLPKISLLIFLIYWICTLIYVTPNNFIKINLLEYEEYFSTIFYQNWGFFAPPPKSDDKLFYTFINKKDSNDIRTFEIFESLNKLKRDSAPLNSSQNILSYILSGSFHQINDLIIELNNNMIYTVNDNQINDSTLMRKKELIFKKQIQQSDPFTSLAGYGKFVAKKNNIKKLENYNLVLKFGSVPITKFSERNKSKIEDKTISLIFVSDTLNF